MPSFPKPSYYFDFDISKEKKALTNYRNTAPGRAIPAKSKNNLLVATWNIANLGLQKRNKKEYELIAFLINWFDIIALQEVNDNLEGLREIQSFLPKKFSTVFSDKSGNNERMAFLFDSTKIKLKEKFGEVAIPPKEIVDIKIKTINQKFDGFDRNPFLVSFVSGKLEFILVNVHLYFGKDNTADRNRRALEAFAVSRWASLRQRSKYAYIKNIILLGDFNIPRVEPGDPVYDALISKGLRKPEHSTKIASNISDDKNYDQIMFFPGETKSKSTGNTGIFDFDGAVFKELWDQLQSRTKFCAYLRYYLSDHRILWSEFIR